MRAIPKVVLSIVTTAVFSDGFAQSAAPVAGHIDPAVMAQAFPTRGFVEAKAVDARVGQARDAVLKSLGDDARDLVFIPITPCTVWDTRFATDSNSAGAIGNGVTKKFFTHHNTAGGNFTEWGGNPSCPEAVLASIGGERPYAVMMTAYVNDATGNGWVTFYREGDPDPSQATISVYYSPGPTRTQTVIAKSARGYTAFAYDVAVTGRFASANVAASVVGYFLKPVNIVMPNSTSTTGNIVKAGGRFLHNFGDDNVFLGREAGNFTMSGYDNVGVGAEAMMSVTAGLGSLALGYQALRSMTDAPYSTAVGYTALRSTTTGFGNTALGAYAMYANTTGELNVGLGADALINNMTGTRNIAVGLGAGRDVVNTSGNIHIGSPGTAADTATLRIGGGVGNVLSRAFVGGIRGVTTGIANAVTVMIDGAGQLGTASSSREVKDHIADMDRASADLMKLRPVTFHYKAHGDSGTLQYGLVAEEVEQVYPELVAKTNDGRTETVMYQFLPPMLLNEYQKQQRTIAEQQARIDAQDARIAALVEAVGRLERRAR